MVEKWQITTDEQAMNRSFFTQQEAQEQVGSRVSAAAGFPFVPPGTVGSVVRARRHDGENWVVCVEWDLPKRSTAYLAIVGDLSFNIPWRSKRPADELSRDEFQRLVNGPSDGLNQPA